MSNIWMSYYFSENAAEFPFVLITSVILESRATYVPAATFSERKTDNVTTIHLNIFITIPRFILFNAEHTATRSGVSVVRIVIFTDRYKCCELTPFRQRIYHSRLLLHPYLP